MADHLASSVQILQFPYLDRTLQQNILPRDFALMHRSLIHPAPASIHGFTSRFLHRRWCSWMLHCLHRQSRVLSTRRLLGGRPSDLPCETILLLPPNLAEAEALLTEYLAPCTQITRSIPMLVYLSRRPAYRRVMAGSFDSSGTALDGYSLHGCSLSPHWLHSHDPVALLPFFIGVFLPA